MLGEFRKFVLRGNVLDLAIAVIIGAAFGAIVSSLTEDIIMPLIGYVTGGLDFSSYFVRLGVLPAGIPATDYAALKKAGVPLIGYGQFLTVVINFLIVAFIIFLVIKAANRAAGMTLGGPAATPEDTLLLREIRDSLKGPKI